MTSGITLFFSYAHRDEALRDELAKHLSQLERSGVLKSWHDRQISPGSEWAGQIDQHLEQAQIILLLISSDFLASNYCYDIELEQAIERHQRGEAVVIPVILHPVDWQGASFSHLQALPKNAQAVTTWANQDEAFTDIARGIRHGLALAEADLTTLMQMFGGHPYLIRVALYAMAKDGTPLATFLTNAPTQAGLYGEHLRHHLENLADNEALRAAMQAVVKAPGPVQIPDQAAFKLKSMGLIRLQGDRVEPLGDLYCLYLRSRLGG